MANKGIVDYFRSGVKFSERLFKNIFYQLKWLWHKSNSTYSWMNIKMGSEWYYKTTYIIIISFVAIFIVLPVLLFFALIKSI